ncbi:MAG: maleylpyruvate isomerase N-terminal domain-containing protein [Acidimicrobiia bacterium]|nr:maleylpyruvate isomerase N-terminal domain-containing protein [Acidimicrobiia bacterium]MBT8214293.1 maleylpyruvate isomerase N-terminal domain-containing protein [Acidimicrobiia bacterium]
MDFAQIYNESRVRLTELARGLDPDRLATIVPACPAWTVQDTVAHVTGIAADVLEGIPASGSDRTAEQVTSRRDKTITEVCDEWRELGPKLEDLLAKVGKNLALVVMDLWTHEQDVRGAVGMKGVRDGDGLELTLKSAIGVGPRLDAVGLPPIALTIPGAPKVFTLGTMGEPAIDLTGDRYELARTFMARRTLSQMAQLDWSGDPAAYLPHLGAFELPTTDLVE